MMDDDQRRSRLSHVNAAGEAHMVDVGDKTVTRREAEAEGLVTMSPATLEQIRKNTASKGDVLTVARIAGIMAAKRTAELIPLCHSLALTGIEVHFVLDEDASCVHITSRARIYGQTGVEMEALTAVTVAALTIYDMCKAVDRGMTIEHVRLLHKSGGQSGTFQAS